MKRKQWFKAAISLGVGTVLLTAAVFANYDNANGYAVCKNALKEVLFQTNYTLNAKIEAKLDGESLASMEHLYQVNGGGNPSRYNKEVVTTLDRGVDEMSSIRQDGQIISMNSYNGGESFHNTIGKDYTAEAGNAGQSSSALVSNEMEEKVLRFAEALCDTFVGDLKNNFVMTDSDKDNRTYSITLNRTQMPDLVSAGISLMVQGIKESHVPALEGDTETDERNAETMLYRALFGSGEPSVDTASLVMSVNNEGLPTQGRAEVSVFGVDADGKGHTLVIALEAAASNYGTTEIARIDPDTIPNLQRLGGRYSSIMLDEDDTEEERAERIKDAEEMAQEGETVHVLNSKGEIIQIISSPDDAVYDEDTGVIINAEEAE